LSETVTFGAYVHEKWQNASRCKFGLLFGDWGLIRQRCGLMVNIELVFIFYVINLYKLKLRTLKGKTFKAICTIFKLGSGPKFSRKFLLSINSYGLRSSQLHMYLCNRFWKLYWLQNNRSTYEQKTHFFKIF
jgi:hypothetical protein